jgi:hypothetical protein
MKLEQILQNKVAQKKIHDAPVICLQATEYPMLFCRSFINFLSRTFAVPIISADMDSEHVVPRMAQLQTTFLGQPSWYWLHADTSLTKNTCDTWYSFLLAYTGPNKLILCSTKQIAKIPASWCVVQLPTSVDKSLFVHLANMVALKQSHDRDHLFKMVQKVPLDTAILLCLYVQLIGKNNQTFFDNWLPQLVVPELSLFSLSQALFARKSQQFFLLWHRLGSMYSPQFWISFWSEQFWRAYCYVRLQKNGKGAEAKKIGYRLPFLFLNSGWRTCDLSELQHAHHFLYEIDYHVKQGGSEYSLELLYARFLNKLM